MPASRTRCRRVSTSISRVAPSTMCVMRPVRISPAAERASPAAHERQSTNDQTKRTARLAAAGQARDGLGEHGSNARVVVGFGLLSIAFEDSLRVRRDAVGCPPQGESFVAPALFRIDVAEGAPRARALGAGLESREYCRFGVRDASGLEQDRRAVLPRFGVAAPELRLASSRAMLFSPSSLPMSAAATRRRTAALPASTTFSRGPASLFSREPDRRCAARLRCSSRPRSSFSCGRARPPRSRSALRRLSAGTRRRPGAARPTRLRPAGNAAPKRLSIRSMGRRAARKARRR